MCSDPGTPPNGRRFGDSFTAGSAVAFYCDSPYTLRGSQIITCDSSGQWDSDLPVCELG